MAMERLTKEQFMDRFDASVHDKIDAAAVKCGATHLVLYENQDMSSSCLGDRSALCVGPSCTRKTPDECDGQWLNDLPSQRQYAVAYCEV